MTKTQSLIDYMKLPYEYSFMNIAS